MIEAKCYWGIADDVCVCVSGCDGEHVQVNLGECAVELPLTQAQARDLAEQLISAAEECARYEAGLQEDG